MTHPRPAPDRIGGDLHPPDASGPTSLLTELAAYQFRGLLSANRPGSIPSGAVIPRDVLQLVSQHRWSLLRAWREYLWLSKEAAARRVGIHVVAYAELEINFTRLRSDAQAQLVEQLFGLLPSPLGCFQRQA